MINGFLQAIYSFLSFLIGLFPSGSGFPTAFHDATQALGGYLHILDPLVPINILLSCVLLIFGVEIALWGFKMFRWIFSHVPFIGGK